MSGPRPAPQPSPRPGLSLQPPRTSVSARRPRLTDAETAARVLDAAVARVAESGVHVALDQVSFERAIEDAQVSRASAYRRWPTKVAFHADVLAETARRTRLEPDSETDIAALHAGIADLWAATDGTQGRRDLIVEALRLAVSYDLSRLRASAPYRTYLTLAAALTALPAGIQPEVGRALAETQRRFDRHRAAVFAGLPDLIGYRLTGSGPDPLLDLTHASGALMTGILLRSFADPATLSERSDRSPYGSSVSRLWSDPEVQLVGLFLAHLEPDPDVIWDATRVQRSRDLLADRAAWAARLRDAQRDTAPGEDRSAVGRAN